MKIDIACMHEACEGQCRASVRVQRWRPGAKMTEIETRMETVYVFFYTCKLSHLRTMTGKLYGRLYLWTVCTVAEVASLV